VLALKDKGEVGRGGGGGQEACIYTVDEARWCADDGLG